MIEALTHESTGTYYNKDTDTYELWVVDGKRGYQIGSISGCLPIEQRKEIESMIWDSFIKTAKKGANQ